MLGVQAPYRANLRRLHLGRTLDVGCATGRNLAALDPGSVGVDHNPHSVEIACKAGLSAVTIEQFLADADLTRSAGFDSMLVAHVVEHLLPDEARAVLARDLGLVPERSYSFPFPRFVGRVFTYNEFVQVSRTPA